MAKRPKKPNGKSPAGMDENPTIASTDIEDGNQDEFLELMRQRAADAWAFWDPLFQESIEDCEYLMGGEKQWKKQALLQRRAEQRPSFTFNELPQYVHTVTGDMRMNGYSIHVSPGDEINEGAARFVSGGNVEKDYSASEVIEGMVRQIEYKSNASRHYIEAGTHATQSGFGWLRLHYEYAGPRSFTRSLRVRHIQNRFSCIIDPNWLEPDASDMGYGFVFGAMRRKEFEKKYPGKSEGDLGDSGAFWSTGHDELIQVAEYMERVFEKRRLLMLQNADESVEIRFEDELEGEDRKILDLYDKQVDGRSIKMEREAEFPRAYWWLVTANAVLRQRVKLPFSRVPIAPVFGRQIRIGNSAGKVQLSGLIRGGKEPTAAQNWMLTAGIEKIAQAPNDPLLVTDKMVEGHQPDWKSANKGNRAFLTYTHDPAVPGGPRRADTSPRANQELQYAFGFHDKIMSCVGLSEASLGFHKGDQSGKAMQLEQYKGGIATADFPDNLAMAIESIGKLCVEAFPIIHDQPNERVRIRQENGAGDNIVLNKTEAPGADGKPHVINDLGIGQHDLRVKAGPSFLSLRQEAQSALSELGQNQAIAPLVADKIVENSDWPGKDAIARRLRVLVPPEALSAEEIEDLQAGKPQQQEQPPTPEQEVAARQAEADMRGADADIAQAEAKTIEAQAKIAEAQRPPESEGGDGPVTKEFVIQVVANAVARAMQEQRQ